MEKIQFIVDRLRQPPFNMRVGTMADFDGKSSIECLDIICEIIATIDPDQADLRRESVENRIPRILHFLSIMKFGIAPDQVDHFKELLNDGDKDLLHSIMHWCLQRFEHLKKRAYLAKYLLPVEVTPEFINEPLIQELMQRLKELQADFKEIHKTSEAQRGSGARPGDLKAEIQQLEQERVQLQNKINRIKKDIKGDDSYFTNMLKATSNLRKEQEEEARIADKIREQRAALQAVEARCSETSRRLTETRNSGSLSQSPDELLAKLQSDVRAMIDRKDSLESALSERAAHLEKLAGWETSDRMTTEDDVRNKRIQLRETERALQEMQVQLDAALERNPKLSVFKQASTLALSKLREREEALDKLEEEKRRLSKLTDEREEEIQRIRGAKNPALGKMDLKKYGAQVRDKIDKYKKMRDELSNIRAELVVLQRTEQILKGKLKNLDEFLTELEKKKGVQGYRDTQRALIEMSEKTAQVDSEKGATLEQISAMVEQISREFKSKMIQIQPLMGELKMLRQEFMDLESKHGEKKAAFDRLTVGLAVEQGNMEKECDLAQEECIREESRYQSLNCLVQVARIKLDRAEQEKKWQENNGRMLRDFASFKELYAQKLAQQEQLTKQLRKRHKELKEDAHAMSNQKTNFQNLMSLLEEKVGAAAAADGALMSLGGMPVAVAEAISFK